MMAAAIATAWSYDNRPRLDDVDEGAEQLRGELQNICDSSMPRVKLASQKNNMYWWSPELAN